MVTSRNGFSIVVTPECAQQLPIASVVLWPRREIDRDDPDKAKLFKADTKALHGLARCKW
jgi:hypothetical protein